MIIGWILWDQETTILCSHCFYTSQIILMTPSFFVWFFFSKMLTTLLLSFAIQQWRWKRDCILQTWYVYIHTYIYFGLTGKCLRHFFTLYPVLIARQQDRNIQSTRCSVGLPRLYFLSETVSNFPQSPHLCSE